MQSPALRKYIRNGNWTTERIYDQLESGSKNYLSQVLSGATRPSESYAKVIRNIIVPPKEIEKVSLESLFPLLANT